MNRKVEIRNNLESVKERIAVAAQKAQRDLAEITLVVVTKTFEVGDLEILYELGEREFGENRDQEASKKAEQLPDDINWHFQGQIQSNKLKSICKWADFIHSVDQIKYAQIISDQCQTKPKSIFLQVSLDTPVESRGGVDPIKLENLASDISELPGVFIAGLMAVAPVDNEGDQAFKRVQMIHSNFKHQDL